MPDEEKLGPKDRKRTKKEKKELEKQKNVVPTIGDKIDTLKN
jgi:hypothetical protein